MWCVYQYFPGEPGAEVSGGETYKPKKELAYSRMCVRTRKATNQVHCPNGVSCVHQPSAVPLGGVSVVAVYFSLVCPWWSCNVV